MTDEQEPIQEPVIDQRKIGDQLLLMSISTIARSNREFVDLNQVRGILSASTEPDLFIRLNELVQQMSWPKLDWKSEPDQARLPMIMVNGEECAVITGRKTDGTWILRSLDSESKKFTENTLDESPEAWSFARMS